MPNTLKDCTCTVQTLIINSLVNERNTCLKSAGGNTEGFTRTRHRPETLTTPPAEESWVAVVLKPDYCPK